MITIKEENKGNYCNTTYNFLQTYATRVDAIIVEYSKVVLFNES